MPDALPNLVPESYTTESPKSAFFELCSLKRLGVTVRDELVASLPKAIQYVKEKKAITPILESAAVTSAKGNTVNGARIVRRTLEAMLRGDFTSEHVAQTVLVALRDAICALESELEENESNLVVQEASTPLRDERNSKDLRTAFRTLIGTREDPRCGNQLHQSLTDTGFTTEPWFVQQVKRAVKESVGNRPDTLHYAKLLADSPPDSPIANGEPEGIRLGVWSL